MLFLFVTRDADLTFEVFVSDGFDEVSETRTVTVKNVETPKTPEVKMSEESKSRVDLIY